MAADEIQYGLWRAHDDAVLWIFQVPIGSCFFGVTVDDEGGKARSSSKESRGVEDDVD